MTDLSASRLALLRAEIKKQGVQGFAVPRADEFLGEYVPACNDRLAWITGFTGSAGSAVILEDKAAFFTDGRYTLQAQQEVDAQHFEIYSISADQSPTPTMTPAEWVAKNLSAEARLGLFAWAHTPDGLADRGRAKGLKTAAGGRIALLDINPLDTAWGALRPAPPATAAVKHPLEFSGVESKVKRDAVAAALKAAGAKALAVMLPEEICWLLNVRGDDVPRTPFVLSYALAHVDETVDWFVDAKKLSQETRDWVGADVRIHPLENFAAHLAALAKQGGTIWIDPAASPVRVQALIEDNGATTHEAASPIQMMKAIKNDVEIAGAINAHIRDGVAVTRFLAAVLAPGAAAKHDEISASDMLESFRAEEKHFKGLSFDTISGAGGNGAIVHYRADENKPRTPLLSGPVYLVDSGGQYLDSTTDVTRTLAVDPAKVTQEMRKHFTLVLKGHIAVASAVFPEGTTGQPLDVKARAALKAEGLDYAHGTGHGVGSYLSVHEGPCGISSRATTALVPGMVISNEPGFYKAGEYGIRIESLVLVTDTGDTDADGKRLFALRTLTKAPIDRNLIDPALLSPEERRWLDDYHADVRETLMPLLQKTDPKAAAFLQAATAPITALKP